MAILLIKLGEWKMRGFIGLVWFLPSRIVPLDIVETLIVHLLLPCVVTSTSPMHQLSLFVHQLSLSVHVAVRNF